MNNLTSKLVEPNLPKSKTTYVFISNNFPFDMEKELNNLNISTIRLDPCINIKTEVKYHPDIICCNIDKGAWYFEPNNYETIVNKLETTSKGSNKITLFTGNVLYNGYPDEVSYNCFTLGEQLFCSRYTSSKIREYAFEHKYEIIKFNQGYVKCSIAVLNEYSMITSDIGVYKILNQLNYNVLLIDGSDINLNGFSCGFIGGCSGMIDKNKIVFTGNIELMRDYKIIRDFCSNINIDLISLGKDKLYDYGGILPIYEL